MAVWERAGMADVRSHTENSNTTGTFTVHSSSHYPTRFASLRAGVVKWPPTLVEHLELVSHGREMMNETCFDSRCPYL